MKPFAIAPTPPPSQPAQLHTSQQPGSQDEFGSTLTQAIQSQNDTPVTQSNDKTNQQTSRQDIQAEPAKTDTADKSIQTDSESTEANSLQPDAPVTTEILEAELNDSEIDFNPSWYGTIQTIQIVQQTISVSLGNSGSQTASFSITSLNAFSSTFSGVGDPGQFADAFFSQGQDGGKFNFASLLDNPVFDNLKLSSEMVEKIEKRFGNAFELPFSGQASLFEKYFGTQKPSSAFDLLTQKIDSIIKNANQHGLASITHETLAGELTQAGLPANKPEIGLLSPEQLKASAQNLANSGLGSELIDRGISKVALQRQESFQFQATEFRVEQVQQQTGQNLQQSFADTSSGNNQQPMQQHASLSFGVNEAGSTFSQTAAQAVQAVQTPQVSSPAQPVSQPTFIPGQHLYHETEVMNQLVQRFNVNPRLQTSKLSMQLHPVELGELKIDILVKGDSIKASIVTQSQMVQEMIDRNMARLKTVLEEQGFRIDDLVVSSAEDENGGFNLFHENNSPQQEFDQWAKNTSPPSTFELPVEELVAESEDEENNPLGVNVKV